MILNEEQGSPETSLGLVSQEQRQSNRLWCCMQRQTESSSAPLGDVELLLPPGSAKVFSMIGPPPGKQRQKAAGDPRCTRNRSARAKLLPAEPQAPQRAPVEQTQLPLLHPLAKPRTKHSTELPGRQDKTETRSAAAQVIRQFSNWCVSTKQAKRCCWCERRLCCPGSIGRASG